MSSHTTTVDPATGRAPATHWGAAIGIALAAAAIVGIVVLAFIWPVATASAKNLPIAIAGPAAAVTPVSEQIEKSADGAVKLTEVDDEDAAVDAITHREVYGAIIVGQQPRVLTASGASPQVAQLLTGVATQLQAGLSAQVAAAGGDPSSVKVEVEDVVPLAEGDPTGAGLAAVSFPIVLGGLIGGILISLRVVGAGRHIVSLLVYGAVAGIGLTAVLQPWFGILQGDFWVNSAAIGLAMLATGAVITGFNALIGPAGIAVGAVITMFIGNPISGAALPWQFIAEPWGEIGHYFVPGAASSLVRSLSYFPDADTSMQWIVLAAWAMGGLLLTVIGHFRSGNAVVEVEPARQPLAAHPDSAARPTDSAARLTDSV